MCIAWHIFYVCLFDYLNHLCFLFGFWNNLKLLYKLVILTNTKLSFLMLLHYLMGFLVPTPLLKTDLLHKIPNVFPILHQKMCIFPHRVSQIIASWIYSPERNIERVYREKFNPLRMEVWATASNKSKLKNECFSLLKWLKAFRIFNNFQRAHYFNLIQN